MFDAGRVVYVAEDMVGEGRLEPAAALVEESKLAGTEIVEAVAVGTHKVGEDRAGDDSVLMLQAVDEPVHVLAGIEAQSVHAGVELDVYGIVGDALLLGRLDKRFEQNSRMPLMNSSVAGQTPPSP